MGNKLKKPKFTFLDDGDVIFQRKSEDSDHVAKEQKEYLRNIKIYNQLLNQSFYD